MPATKTQKQRKKQYVKEIKLNGKCTICGTKENLEFHHRNPKTKISEISTLIHKGSWKQLKAEIKKCDLVCTTCHRRIHMPKTIPCEDIEKLRNELQGAVSCPGRLLNPVLDEYIRMREYLERLKDYLEHNNDVLDSDHLVKELKELV